MNPEDLLMLVVEASLGLAGFAGVVTALERRDAGGTRSRSNLNLVNLLATAFGALFLSLGALGLLSAGVDESGVWRTASAVGLVVMLFFSVRSAIEVTRAIGPERALRAGTLYAINVPVAFVCAAQLWNAATGGAFWAFFVLLIALFAIGCFSFVRLLIPPD